MKNHLNLNKSSRGMMCLKLRRSPLLPQSPAPNGCWCQQQAILWNSWPAPLQLAPAWPNLGRRSSVASRRFKSQKIAEVWSWWTSESSDNDLTNVNLSSDVKRISLTSQCHEQSSSSWWADMSSKLLLFCVKTIFPPSQALSTLWLCRLTCQRLPRPPREISTGVLP